MSQQSAIEWTDVSWNPVHGCSTENAAENVILKPHYEWRRSVGRLGLHLDVALWALPLPRVVFGAYVGGIEDGIAHNFEVAFILGDALSDPICSIGFNVDFGRRVEHWIPSFLWRG